MGVIKNLSIKQVRKTFVILFKDSLKIETYTSLKAVSLVYSKEEIGASYYMLNKVDYAIDTYENNKIRVELSITRTPGEVRRQREQFL